MIENGTVHSTKHKSHLFGKDYRWVILPNGNLSLILDPYAWRTIGHADDGGFVSVGPSQAEPPVGADL